MTVIAWDGKTLAADRQWSVGDTRQEGRKIFQEPDGTIFAISGALDSGLFLFHEWWKAGALKEDWPSFQSDKDKWTRLIVWPTDKSSPIVYELVPIGAQIVTAQYYAWGTGREVALGVLWHKGTAIEAVEAANCHVSGCGFGVDSFTR